jgi:hypothetical protein
MLPRDGVFLAPLLNHFPELGRGCVGRGEPVLVLVHGAENDPGLAVLGQDDISVGRLSKILVRVRSKFLNAYGSHRTSSDVAWGGLSRMARTETVWLSSSTSFQYRQHFAVARCHRGLVHQLFLDRASNLPAIKDLNSFKLVQSRRRDLERKRHWLDLLPTTVLCSLF